MKKLSAVIRFALLTTSLFAMVFAGTGLILSVSQAKAEDFECNYYYTNGFGSWYGGGYYTHRPSHWNGYRQGYYRGYYWNGYRRGYWNGYYNNCDPQPYFYKPYPFWNGRYQHFRPYNYKPRFYYRSWRYWQ